jgi:hypothetical protein
MGLGGGCHWCTEAVFQAPRGVSNVAQGFIRAPAPNEAWSEAVIVTFDPSEIDEKTLIDIHLRTHASTSPHKFRGKYRSAVYVFDDGQRLRAERDLHELQADFDEPLVNQVFVPSRLQAFGCTVSELLCDRSGAAILPDLYRPETTLVAQPVCRSRRHLVDWFLRDIFTRLPLSTDTEMLAVLRS